MYILFYRNFRLLILAIVLIIVWGLSSYQSLPRLEDPELTSRVAVVKTFFPGASAERVEALVTEKIEKELSAIEEIETYESTSRAGVSIITVELLERVNRERVDGVWSRVRDKLRDAQVKLPSGATDPELAESEVRAYALLAALTWEQDDPPNYAILYRRAKSLEDELRAIAGTEDVEIFGAPDEEIAVEVSSADLAALGITAQQLSQQIQQSDSKAAAGQLRANHDLLIEVKGELDSLERIRQIPIRCNACGTDAEGQFIHLSNIAQVKKGIVEPASNLALIGDRPAVVVGAYVESDYRLDRWAKVAHKTLDQFRQQLPSGMKLQVLLDQNTYVTARLNNLILNLLFGAVLLFAVTIFMMGFQSALVVQAALPLSVLIVFGCMGLIGIPLHQMSVTGLIVSLGILIDNAIIVVDEVQNRLKQGLPPATAVAESVRYLTAPLIAATLTTVISFLPIPLLPGSVGEFVGTIGLNVILAVSASLFVALTITPVLAARLHRYWTARRIRRSGLRSTPIWWQDGFSHPLLTHFYRRTLDWTYARPMWGIVLSLILPLAGFGLATTLELQFFPPADRDQMRVEVELPASASLQQTQSLVQQVQEKLLQHAEVVDVNWFIGESAPQIYYNQPVGREGESNFANAIVQLQEVAPNSLLQQLQALMDEAFPAARVLVRQFEQGPPFDAPIELRIYGSDLNRLQELGEQTRTLLAQTAKVTHTRARLNEVQPQLGLRVDEEAARSLGLSHASIAQQLDTTLEGIQGGSVLESTEDLPVRVRLSNSVRGDLDQIRSLDLLTPSREAPNSLNSTPLLGLGEVQLEPKPSAITRRNGQRVNTVQGFIAVGTLPATVLPEFQQRLTEQLKLPSGYSFEFGGEVEERSSAVGNLFGSVGVLIVAMIATLVLSLGSFKLASLIGAIAVCSVGLGALSIGLFGYPFGFNPIIGTVGLIGVAVNDSITVLTALKEDPAASRGDRKAVRQVVIHATRHVLTTTLTTMIGFVPLIAGGGGFWPPLAVPIAGGVAGATLLALYFIPSAYLLLVRWQSKTTSTGMINLS